MSRNQTEKQYKSTTVNAKGPKASPGNRYIVYRPAESEKAQIKADKLSLESVIERIAAKVSFDAKLSIGFKPENGAFFVHLTDTSVQWQEAVTLAVWHVNPLTALRSLEFGLRDRYAEFPDISQPSIGEELGW